MPVPSQGHIARNVGLSEGFAPLAPYQGPMGALGGP
jgi:hypothetical protein